jgi:single-strand DNA-binding protein
MNKVILVGRLAKEPELHQTASGVSVCSFTVACDRRFQKEGERQADFINCVAWRRQAEFISKYFTKGTRIALEGSIQVRSWDDNDGNKRCATEVIVDHAEFAQSKTEGGGTTNEQATPSGNIDGFVPVDGERLPWE